MKKIILLTTLLLCFLSVKASAKGFGLSPHKEGERPKGSYSEIDDNSGKWIGSDDKRVYLTFDCGYENGYTKDILQTLKNNNVKATFFLVGFWIEKYPEMVKEIYNNGFEIGIHSNTHPDMTKLTKTEIYDTNR